MITSYHQEAITIWTVYERNNIALKYMKKEKKKEYEKYSNPQLQTEFNIPLSKIDSNK